jgi:hypothetical protein
MGTYKIKRRNKRINVNLPVTYVYADESKPSPNDGTTFDICQSGMSFYTNTPLKEGLNIEVQTNIWRSPKKCVIKWQSRKSHSTFKVGVSFR